jgi:hypothetical protein
MAMCFAALGGSAVCSGQMPQALRPLAERFRDPPAAARIIPIIHRLPLTPAEQDARFQTLLRQGFGGFVSNVSFHDYLENEEHWRAFVRGVTEAKRLGMSLWLYDERGYPSGLAGGLTMRGHPEFEARGLLVADKESDGGQVSLDLPPGKRVLTAAFPVRDGVIAMEKPVDLSARVKDGRLQWERESEQRVRTAALFSCASQSGRTPRSRRRAPGRRLYRNRGRHVAAGARRCQT